MWDVVGFCLLSGQGFPCDSAVNDDNIIIAVLTNPNAAEHGWIPGCLPAHPGVTAALQHHGQRREHPPAGSGAPDPIPELPTSRDNAALSCMQGQSSYVNVGMCETEIGDLMAAF